MTRKRAHCRATPFRATAAILAGFAGAVALSTVAAARERRRLLGRGEIRPLADLWTTVNGWRVYARACAGAKTPAGVMPVVCVHGFGVAGSYFVPCAERLAVDIPVYVPDLPGHGRSEAPAVPLDVPGMADALVAWMDAVGIRRASLLANSMGCQTAVDAALRYPTRIDRLVLIGPTVDPAARSVLQLFLRLVACGPFERLSILWILAKDYSRMGPRLVPEFRFMRRDRIERKLPQLGRANVPVMLVRGGHDAVAPQSWIDEVARLARAARVAVFPHWGHAVHYSAPEEFIASVIPFLRQPAAGPGRAAPPGGTPVNRGPFI